MIKVKKFTKSIQLKRLTRDLLNQIIDLKEEKEKLREKRESLDYFEICEKLKKLLIKLDKAYQKKYILQRSREHEYINKF